MAAFGDSKQTHLTVSVTFASYSLSKPPYWFFHPKLGFKKRKTNAPIFLESVQLTASMTGSARELKFVGHIIPFCVNTHLETDR